VNSHVFPVSLYPDNKLIKRFRHCKQETKLTQLRPYQIAAHIISKALAACVLFSFSNAALAWGPVGHSAIAILAVDQLSADVRGELEKIVGPLDAHALEEACNWPDAVLETKVWSWSAPLHYVNIPRGNFVYQQSRDCPARQCATEAIKEYADQLADRQLGIEKRRQAFAWLCHVTGDLHQPLHAGFADDRGGNNFEVRFDDRQINLHGFWDYELIKKNAGSSQHLVRILNLPEPIETGSDWSINSVDDWTDESHELTKTVVYPGTIILDEAYQQQSWVIAQKQMILAASRLALIINTRFENTK
jgi:hypothetical protein